MVWMGNHFRSVTVLVALLSGALTSAAQEPGTIEGVRVTGTISAVRETLIQVPRIEGQTSRITLTWLIPNSSEVKEGDILAEFDRTQQLDLARQALAQYEDLQHKLEQKKAENRANQEERAEAVARAEADLAKARVQLRVSEVRGDIERAMAEVREKDALARLESLAKSHEQHEIADQAALRLLELQMERQKTAYERAERNTELLVMRAPLDGMVAHEYIPRSGSLGPPQIGDQMYRGYPLMRLFDPTEMEVQARVGEPDGETLVIGAKAVVLLDAYPDASFPARLVAASPVASGGLDSPIKQFNARFALDARDPRLMPDLTAAVVILPGAAQTGGTSE